MRKFEAVREKMTVKIKKIWEENASLEEKLDRSLLVIEEVLSLAEFENSAKIMLRAMLGVVTFNEWCKTDYSTPKTEHLKVSENIRKVYYDRILSIWTGEKPDEEKYHSSFSVIEETGSLNIEKIPKTVFRAMLCLLIFQRWIEFHYIENLATTPVGSIVVSGDHLIAYN